MNRPYLSPILFALGAAALSAQDDLDALRAAKGKKFDSEFLQLADWHTEFSAVRSAAGDSGKLVLAYFSRSYAPCPPCLALENGLLQSEEFLALAEGVELFFHNTSGLPEDDDGLLGRKGGSGFPQIMVLDQHGEVLARIDGDRTISRLRRLIGDAQKNRERLAKLGRAASTGDGEAARRLLQLELALGRLDPIAAYGRLAAMEDLDPARRRKLHAAIVSQEVGAIQVTATYDQETQVAAGKRFAKMLREGRVPQPEDAFFFWYFGAVYAESANDRGVLEQALRGLAPHANRTGGLYEKWTSLLADWDR